ncbi:hypothetical protein [Paenibacillus sp. NPDC058071]|uniref:hypothetical protein n=1 Tax=Paenibacillus sp. NPDC058071 TaxID=3346326 RepID=UPI0036DAD543
MRMWLILLAVLLWTTGCSKADKEIDSYAGRGQHWDAYVEKSTLERNGERLFHIRYEYKGSEEELRSISHIVFAQGTSLDSQAVTVFDNAGKAERAIDGNNEEEELNEFGVMLVDFKHKTDPIFNVPYKFNHKDKGLDTFKAIESDRLNVQIVWEDDRGQYKESFDIKAE